MAGNYWRECNNRGKSRERTKGRGSWDDKMWLCFLSSILFRQWDEGRECNGMKPWKEALDCISQISASFTHWQRPSFPFPPIISTSSYVVLGKGGGAFLSALFDDVIHSSTANKNPLRPEPQPPASLFKTPPHAFLKSGTFSDLSGKRNRRVGRQPFMPDWVILLNCSLNKQQLRHWFCNPGLFALKPHLFIFLSRRTNILYIRFTSSVFSVSLQYIRAVLLYLIFTQSKLSKRLFQNWLLPDVMWIIHLLSDSFTWLIDWQS